jgi:hypothetical protein
MNLIKILCDVSGSFSNYLHCALYCHTGPLVMNLAFFLEDLFQRKVDLVTPNSLSPYIGPYVKNEVVWAE